jgi:hypothetical protein
MIDTALYGSLTIGSLIAVVVFTWLAFIFVHRWMTQSAAAGGEDVAVAPAVLKKLRKRERLSDEEMAIAADVIARRRSLLAYSIPAAIFSIGCFYVFGSLEHLHGATPSERTFLGLIPMFTAANVTLQLLRSARLKRRLLSEPRPRRGMRRSRRDARPHPAPHS